MLELSLFQLLSGGVLSAQTVDTLHVQPSRLLLVLLSVGGTGGVMSETTGDVTGGWNDVKPASPAGPDGELPKSVPKHSCFVNVSGFNLVRYS